MALDDRGDEVEAQSGAGGERLDPVERLEDPLAIGRRDAGPAPMAHAVIGGLISSTMLTLVVVPVMLTYTDALSGLVKRLFRRRPPAHHDSEAVTAEAIKP